MNNGKHLTEENRYEIELYINEGLSFTKISKIIDKDRTTISKEIKRNRIKKIPKSSNRFIPKNFCIYKHRCGKSNCTSDKSCFIEDICPKLLKPPYVYNPCSQKKTCRRIKYYYYSNLAHKSHIQLLSDSRTGINLTENQIALIDKEISPLLLKQNQPINHIYSYKKEILPFSKPTFYSYINKNVFTFRNVDLPRKVKLKPRKSHNIPIVKKDKSYRINRTYEDYPKYITLHPNAYIVQMYTVEGIKGGKVFLTFLFVKNNLMLIFLLDNKDTDCVFYAFEFIKHSIGIKNFMKYFEVILTDNGSEFSDPVSIETDIDTGEIVSNVFYCDSGKSWQKGNIEKNHEYIRYVLPKGSSFDNLTQEDTNLLMNHINSTCRDSLNGKSPYDLATHMNFLNNLNIQLIAPSEVNLSKDLLKK